MKSREVDGMLLDRYTASYCQKMDKLKSLVTFKKLDFQRDVGILIAKDGKDPAECMLELLSIGNLEVNPDHYRHLQSIFYFFFKKSHWST